MRKCANCEYFDGSCKRFPATVKVMGTDKLTRHPVDSEDWCGEFLEKLGEFKSKESPIAKELVNADKKWLEPKKRK